ncbi:hypothetical protein DOJK_02260 [Patescibacteria group bacterium]|nr:hypothetical protein DOJK_02260 [Patescibacteria group bacterium]
MVRLGGVKFFFKESKKININPEILKRAKYKIPNNELSNELSFAAGLVFCHHNAPIYRITELAKKLADLAKEKYTYQNAFAYQILKSFDHAGIDIKSYRSKRLENLAKPDDLLVKAENMEQLETLLKELKTNEFPKRKSYQMIKALLAKNDDLVNSLKEKIAEDFPNIPDKIQQLENLCGNSNAHWLHLTDLWDYIVLDEEQNHV